MKIFTKRKPLQTKKDLAKSPKDFSYIEGDILYLNEIESKNYFNLITNL